MATTTAGERLLDASSMRRTPHQRRSRERVEHILDSATRLIAERGTAGLKMSHLAREAGVSIGSLYQYFPDQRAVTRTLAARYAAEGSACIRDGLAGVTKADALLRAFGELVDAYYEMFLAEPVMRDIWSGTQADAELREMELADSRENAEILVEALLRAGARAGRDELAAAAFAVMHLGEATMRLAVSVERSEGDRIVATYRRMALGGLAELLDARV